jgi:hypothetical protein
MHYGVRKPLERSHRLEVVAAQHDCPDLDGFHVRAGNGVVAGVRVATRALKVDDSDVARWVTHTGSEYVA